MRLNVQRRQWLICSAAWLLVARHAGAHAAPRATGGPCLAAAWDDAEGRHFIGLLAVNDASPRMPSAAPSPAPLQVQRSIELPTRAHGLLVEPGGSVLAIARRPGDWLLRWWPATGRAQWLWSEPDRRFTGHAVLDSARGQLLSTETDLASGQGLVALRDARTLQSLAEWPTHGIDPHQLLRDADGSLLVANGGVPTLPETGRVKLDRQAMDSSLVRLGARDGERLGQWRLDDARLSIRHLARHADGTLGIALQAEHDDDAARAAAPLLALFDGSALRPVPPTQALAGYGGDIVATEQGFAVAATRAGGVAQWTRAGQWLGLTALQDACPLAPHHGGLWAGGRAEALELSPALAGSPTAVSQRHAAAMRMDNHWVVWN